MMMTTRTASTSVMKCAECVLFIVATMIVLISAINIREGTYLPTNEADRGLNLKSIRTFSSRVREIRRNGGSVTLVLGFSTGHVGTTTFSSREAYMEEDLVARGVKFVFERAGVRPTTCARKDWDFKKEIQHVEYYYGPEILKSVSTSKNSTVVDLSHANICFYKGLINVMHANKVPFTFVRIRRDRVETALSMSIQDDSRVEFFKRDYYRYHPFENTQNVHLKVPGKLLFLSLWI
jgi:hypothetical protein